MRHTDQETAELAQDVTELSRELATLKREHELLRAAAERVIQLAPLSRSKPFSDALKELEGASR